VSVLAGLVGVFAVAVRQSLVLVRRAHLLRAAGHQGEELPVGSDASAPATWMSPEHQAAREMAPAVVGSTVVTIAVLLAPAVVGSIAGLEFLHPLALTVICGLLTSTVMVLVLVPTFLGAVSSATDGRGRHRAPTQPTIPREVRP
jgi:Cu/Ag efflux pump CusA